MCYELCGGRDAAVGALLGVSESPDQSDSRQGVRKIDSAVVTAFRCFALCLLAT